VREENELFYDIDLIKDGPAFLTGPPPPSIYMIFNTNLDRFLIAKLLKSNSQSIFSIQGLFWLWLQLLVSPFSLAHASFAFDESVSKEGFVDQTFTHVNLALRVFAVCVTKIQMSSQADFCLA
jgi:hypothetical protein